MSLSNLLFGRTPGTKLELQPIQARLAAAVREPAALDVDLTRAWLADFCRDANLLPLLPDEFDRAASALDAESQRRTGLLVALLELGAVRAAVEQLALTWPVHQVVSTAFTGLAQETPLLTLEILGQSGQRVEELARRFLAAIRATIAGESADDSKKRLHKIDYGRLLAEAEKAKAAAADRTERLRQLQEQQDLRRAQRKKL